jgi:hypothetical protein
MDMKLAFFQANLILHSVAPDKVRNLRTEEVLAAALLCPDPAVDYATWSSLMKALAQIPEAPKVDPKVEEAEQKAAVASLASDPVMTGLGIKVEETKPETK